MLIVDLVIGTKYTTFRVLKVLDLGEKLKERLLHEPISITHHGVCFTRASLAVNENTAIIAIKGACNKFNADLLKNFLLTRFGWEYLIKAEVVLIQVYLRGGVLHDGLLFLARSNADAYLN